MSKGNAKVKEIRPTTSTHTAKVARFEIGDKVKYVRLNAENKVEEGEGVVCAVLLDHTQRLVYRLQDTLKKDKVFNADGIALNANAATKKRYIDHYFAVRKYSDEQNAKLKKLAEESNAEVERMHTAVLGAPVTL